MDGTVEEKNTQGLACDFEVAMQAESRALLQRKRRQISSF